ncbi:MAG: hypothetical protein GY720_03130, partial [bacterium]|nr:hypothetical protein [bacterium]
GSAQGQADFSPEEYEWITPSATLEVIELGASQHPEALLLTTPVDEAEDPPNRTQLFVSDGKLLRRILNQSYGVYNVTELDFLGDGTFEYTEDGWTACGRLDFPETTVVQEVVTVGLTDGAEMSEIGRRPSELTQDCNNLAACPYVYVLGVEGEELIGEILRNVRGRDAYTTQGLELPTQHGLLHIQLREEKEEVTYLDAIALLVDGEKILPRACGDGSDLGHCSIDGISLRLDEGDVLDLWFEVPPGATSLELNATGYYVPTPKS